MGEDGPSLEHQGSFAFVQGMPRFHDAPNTHPAQFTLWLFINFGGHR